MKDYFLIRELVYDDYKDTLKEAVLNYDNWEYYGTGRFTIYIGKPTRELIIPIATKFKNPKDIFYKIEFNKVKGWGIIAPHTDHDRYATINLPILGDFDNSSVDFYTSKSEGVSSSNRYSEEGQVEVTAAKTYTDAELKEVVQYQTPICFDTQTVHGVTNYSPEDRYILTLSFRPEYTFEKLHDMYKNGELLSE